MVWIDVIIVGLIYWDIGRKKWIRWKIGIINRVVLVVVQSKGSVHIINRTLVIVVQRKLMVVIILRGKR